MNSDDAVELDDDTLDPDDPYAPDITENQSRAISALLEGRSIVATAEHCHVNERTIRRWQRLPVFMLEYQHARRERADVMASRICRHTDIASETIERLVRCGNPAIELRAASIIWQMSRSTSTADRNERNMEAIHTMKGYMFDELEEKTREQTLHLERERAKINKEWTELRSKQSEMNQAAGTTEPPPQEWRELCVALIQGTFRRPQWISRESWEQIINADYTNPAAN